MGFVFGEVDAKVTSSPLPAGAATEAKLEAARALLAGAATEAKLEAVRALLAGTRAVDTELPAAAIAGDADSATIATPSVDSHEMRFNETSWERVRGNTEGVALASAVRSATTTPPQIKNFSARGIVLALDVTVAGTGDLRTRVHHVNPATVTFASFWDGPVVTTTGLSVLVIYPGASGGAAVAGQVISVPQPLPRTFRPQVRHSDASGWTYSLGYSLIV